MPSSNGPAAWSTTATTGSPHPVLPNSSVLTSLGASPDNGNPESKKKEKKEKKGKKGKKGKKAQKKLIDEDKKKRQDEDLLGAGAQFHS
ncbi:hypothetical protein ONZ43_g3924 [Nemania bipapillata]|uniref:Uncharacterized protein n=1 Tax=Nemania bipapillata TaxID=110536 RepID=A0ACC2IUI9_9PEZI|nr:hypothetical protein ONZ43_g3924 [Nemania bipapillata]